MNKQLLKLNLLLWSLLPFSTFAQVDQFRQYLDQNGQVVTEVKLVEKDSLLDNAQRIEFTNNRFTVFKSNGERILQMQYRLKAVPVKLPEGRDEIQRYKFERIGKLEEECIQ